jgi:hypothetical protein
VFVCVVLLSTTVLAFSLKNPQATLTPLLLPSRRVFEEISVAEEMSDNDGDDDGSRMSYTAQDASMDAARAVAALEAGEAIATSLVGPATDAGVGAVRPPATQLPRAAEATGLPFVKTTGSLQV